MHFICTSERLFRSVISDFEETDNLHLVQQLKEICLQRTRFERIQFTFLNQGQSFVKAIEKSVWWGR